MLNLSKVSAVTSSGKVISIAGSSIVAELPLAALGDIVRIDRSSGPLKAQVVSFNENRVSLAPLGSLGSVHPGARVVKSHEDSMLTIGPEIIGSILDAFGVPIPNPEQNSKITHIKSLKNDISLQKRIPQGTFSFLQPTRSVLGRLPVNESLHTGIRSIDSFTRLGKGQRIVILAEPGVGKSSLLLSLADQVEVDLVVVALIGERGREVTEFYQDIQNSEAASKTVLVASTSDEPATVRAQAAETAIRIAEIAADAGLNVLLAFDSLTRYLRSLRDIGLNAGELPIRRGYPASVFEKIPKLIERAGAFSKGSITGIYTMLSTSDVDEDPLVEEVKGLTDGHLVLRRSLAEKGHFPALDIRSSLSRLHRRFWDEESLNKIQFIKSRYSELLDSKDLLMVSGDVNLYSKCEAQMSMVEQFLKQNSGETSDITETMNSLNELYLYLNEDGS